MAEVTDVVAGFGGGNEIDKLIRTFEIRGSINDSEIVSAGQFRDWAAALRTVRDRAKPQRDRENIVAPKFSVTHNLDVDAGERVRALHRIVRALHDGECPRCNRIFPSEDVRQPWGNQCPGCGFQISAAVAAEVAERFAPIMAKNLEVFAEFEREFLTAAGMRVANRY